MASQCMLRHNDSVMVVMVLVIPITMMMVLVPSMQGDINHSKWGAQAPQPNKLHLPDWEEPGFVNVPIDVEDNIETMKSEAWNEVGDLEP
jgi:hypothetical protein